MSRKRYRYDLESKSMVEVPLDWTDAPRVCAPSEELIYGKLRATDGTDLSSRAKHREYMARNNLTLASDFRESWSAESIERTRAAEARAEAADRRSDLIETYKQLTEAKRRR